MAITPPRNSKDSYKKGNDNMSRLKSQIVDDFVHKSDIIPIKNSIIASLPPSPGDNWGSQVAITSGYLTGDGTIGSPLSLGNGTLPGGFLQWDGSDFSEAFPNLWLGTPLTGDGFTTPLKIIDGTNDGDIIEWDSFSTSWVVAGNNWGTQSAITSGAIEGNGLAGTPIKLIDGTTANQILKWDGVSWILSNDSDTIAVTTAGVIHGDGTSGNPIILIDGTSTGQVIKWNGTAWGLSSDADTLTVQSDGFSITGDGTSGNKLKVKDGDYAGDYLKWNNTSSIWEPEPLDVNVFSLQFEGNGSPGVPIKLTETGITAGNIFQVVGGTWVKKDLTLGNGLSGKGIVGDELKLSPGTTTGDVMTWNGSIWVSSPPVNDDDDVETDGTVIIGDGTSGNKIRLSQQSATSGQVLSWNGSQWAPSTLPSSTSKFTALFNGNTNSSNLGNSYADVTTSSTERVYVPAGYTQMSLSFRHTDNTPGTSTIYIRVVGTRTGNMYPFATTISSANTWTDLPAITVGANDEYRIQAYRTYTGGSTDVKLQQIYGTISP